MSLKVIKIHQDAESGTADTTLLSTDNTYITADAAFLSGGYSLRVAPRVFASLVELNLWNEMTSTNTTLECVTTQDNGYMVIPFNYNFNEGDTFEVRVYTPGNTKLLWRGKLLATHQEDLENYTLNVKGPNNIIKI